MMWDEADFQSLDPFVRYSAHQAAKGRATLPDPDVLYDRMKDARSEARYTEDPQAEVDSKWRDVFPEAGCGA